MRKRISDYKTLKAGDTYKGVVVKSVKEIPGSHCPTKAFYDDGTTVANTDKVLRVVLETGFIHYVKLYS